MFLFLTKRSICVSSLCSLSRHTGPCVCESGTVGVAGEVGCFAATHAAFHSWGYARATLPKDNQVQPESFPRGSERKTSAVLWSRGGNQPRKSHMYRVQCLCFKAAAPNFGQLSTDVHYNCLECVVDSSESNGSFHNEYHPE